MKYLHKSPLRVHGRLKSTNCLVDNLWSLKLSDYGMAQYRMATNISDNERFTGLYGFLPFMGTLKLQSNGPLYSNTVIGTLTVDGWAVTFGTARKGLGGLGPRPVPSSLYLLHRFTARSEARYWLRIAIFAYYTCIRIHVPLMG